MGVDLETYRGRIGTFSYSNGLDVVILECVINFSGGIKCTGAVAFIGILLLIAGIESNPGPTDMCQCRPRPAIIKLSGISERTDKNDLVMALEQKTSCRLKNIRIFREKKYGIVEFNKGVELLSSEFNLNVGDDEIIVEPYHSPNTVEIKPFSRRISDELKEYFENEGASGGGRVEFICTSSNWSDTAFVTFRHFNVATRVVGREQHLINGQPVDVSFHVPPHEDLSAASSMDTACEERVPRKEKGIKKKIVTVLGFFHNLFQGKRNSGPETNVDIGGTYETTIERQGSHSALSLVNTSNGPEGTKPVYMTEDQGESDVVPGTRTHESESEISYNDISSGSLSALSLVNKLDEPEVTKPVHMTEDQGESDVVPGTRTHESESEISYNDISSGSLSALSPVNKPDEPEVTKPVHMTEDQSESDAVPGRPHESESEISYNDISSGSLSALSLVNTPDKAEVTKPVHKTEDQSESDAVPGGTHESESEISYNDISSGENSISTAELKSKFQCLLEDMGLSDRFPCKIKIRDVLSIDMTMQDKRITTFKDIPLVLLKKFVAVYSKAMDICATVQDAEVEEESLAFSLFTPEYQTDSQEISPLDIFLVVYQCCDPMLKQLLFQKLHLCKLAVPFIFCNYNTPQLNPQMSLWPLRTLMVENKSIGENGKATGSEYELLDLPTNVVATVRLGRPNFSKSKLLNGLLTDETCSVFFNMDSPHGTVGRYISQDYVEMFWLPLAAKGKDRFKTPLTFLNVRGDIFSQFCKNTLPFVYNITNIAIFVVDAEFLFTFKGMESILTNVNCKIIIILSGVLKIIGKTKLTLLDRICKELIALKQPGEIKIICTHKGSKEMNMSEIIEKVSTLVSAMLCNEKTTSLKTRIKSVPESIAITADETEPECTNGKELAEKVFKTIDADPSQCKNKVTPIQYRLTALLGQYEKEVRRIKDRKQQEKILNKIHETRVKMLSSFSETVIVFLDNVVSCKGYPDRLFFMLGWLNVFINVHTRKGLLELIRKYQNEWENLRRLKSGDNPSAKEINNTKGQIHQLEEKIDDASFSLSHIFREIGQIYDVIILLDNCPEKYRLPPLCTVLDPMATLFIEGFTFELIDGDGFYMPERWIRSLLQAVSQRLKRGRVFTLSVLGVQSSGKSTLLNTMFGSQFQTSSGRCTKGIHMQLLPFSFQGERKESPFEYVLLLDTEGLRGLDLNEKELDHDNQLATLVTGLGDITILNVMGENASVIKDILQIIVHAFLRLKMANPQLDLNKCCAFIHQNVSEITALDKIRPAVRRLMDTLDFVTKEAAKTEGRINIVEFNQVIKFDMTSQVWFLPNLWQGLQPMDRVNAEYSYTVEKIKYTVLQNACTVNKISYKWLGDVITYASDLWKGVLTEDFVFHFRNSLEVKAFNSLEQMFLKVSSDMECEVNETCLEISQKEFSYCQIEENIEGTVERITSQLISLLAQKKIEVEAKLETYFENSNYSDTIIRWKVTTFNRLEMYCREVEISFKEEIKRLSSKKRVDILQTSSRTVFEEELSRKAIQLAHELRSKPHDQTEIDKAFEKFWLTNLIDQSHKSVRTNMIKQIQTCISELFDLFESKQLLDNVYLHISQLSEIYTKERKTSDDIIENLTLTESQFGIIEKLESSAARLCRQNGEITEEDIKVFFRETKDILTENEKEMTGFQESDMIKVCIQVGAYAQRVFGEHNINAEIRSIKGEAMQKVLKSCLLLVFSNERHLVEHELNTIKYSFVKTLQGSVSLVGIKHCDVSTCLPDLVTVDETGIANDQVLETVFCRIDNVFKVIDVLIENLCLKDTEISDTDFRKVLFVLKEKLDCIEKDKCEFTLTAKCKVMISVFVGIYASCAFTNHNLNYCKKQNQRLELSKWQLYDRFNDHVCRRRAEGTAAMLFCRSIEPLIQEIVENCLPVKAESYLMKKLPTSKLDLIICILDSLVNENNFTTFTQYLQNPMAFAEIWIKKKSEHLLFETDSPGYYLTASLKINELFDDLQCSIDECTIHFTDRDVPFVEWFEHMNNNLEHLRIPLASSVHIQEEIETIYDMTNFKKVLQACLGDTKISIEKYFKSITKFNVVWGMFNPYLDICKKRWGCPEKCAFCAEPCFQTNCNMKQHECIQHRPICCNGTRDRKSQEACVMSCCFNIQSDGMHNCPAFDYLCNNDGIRVQCEKRWHKFKDWEVFIKGWKISPVSNMEDGSDFWMWFMATYKEEMAKHHNYKVSNIPDSWHRIKVQSALQNLKRYSDQLDDEIK